MAAVANLFGRGLEIGVSGVEAEAEQYLRSKFAKARTKDVDRTQKKPRGAKLQLTPLAPQAANIEVATPQPGPAAGLTSCRLLGEDSNPLIVPTSNADVTKAEVEAVAIVEIDLDEPPRRLQALLPTLPENTPCGAPQGSLAQASSRAAVRLAAPGTEHASLRICPDGHPMFCYVVAWSCAMCDECDLMQRPGQVTFGCRWCDFEMCSSCAVETAATPEARRGDEEVIARVASGRLSNVARFVGTPSGLVLDGDTNTSTELKTGGGPVHVQGLRSERSAAHCVVKQGPSCNNFPCENSHNNHTVDIDDWSWKQQGPAGARRGLLGDRLSEMLAEQGRIIQQCSLDRQVASEARESGRQRGNGTSTSYTSPPPPTSCGDGHFKPVQLERVAYGVMDEDAARSRPRWACEGQTVFATPVAKKMEQIGDLTLTLAGDFVEELARGYSQPWFQDLVHQCARECGYDCTQFLMRLQGLAFEVQKPILENWGFNGDAQGVYDMTCILRKHSGGANSDAVPAWWRERVDHCLSVLYGGPEGGMLTAGVS